MKPERRMRILVLEPSGNLWGSERVLLDLLRSIPAEEWEIGVCCPPDTPLIGELEKLPVRIFPGFIANLHRRGRLARLLALKNLMLVLRRFRPGLLYVNQAGVARIALLAAKPFRIPVVSSVKLVEDIAAIAALGASERVLPKIICVSHYIRDGFVARGKLPESQLAMIYDPYRPQCDWEVPALPDTGEDSSFACIARLAPSKGQDVVLQALAVLKERGIAATVTFVGSSAPGEVFEQQLLDLTRKLALQERAEWVGTQQDIYAYGTGRVAWICPSRHDPFPRVMLAALDSGNPVIAWEGSGGPAEFIRESGGGILYPHQDGKSLADAMSQMLRTPVEQRQRMVAKGREWIAAHCHPDRAAADTLALWRSILSRRSN